MPPLTGGRATFTAWRCIQTTREKVSPPLGFRVPKRPKDADMKQMVNAILLKIQEMAGVELEGIDSYMNETRLRTKDQWKWEWERQPNKIPGRIAQPTG